MIRVHMIWFTGDLPAVKKFCGLKGHNAKRLCRYCNIEGVWSASNLDYYFPSALRHSGRRIILFDLSPLPQRSVSETVLAIEKLRLLEGKRKSDMQRATGINENSILFSLPNILPYTSFPIDIIHLFYNIGKDRLRLWLTPGKPYSLTTLSVKEIVEELMRFRGGVPSQMASRPRPLSKFFEWKSAEFKSFILSYSLIVLDGHLPHTFLSGWRMFIQLVDICWRPTLKKRDVERFQNLAFGFYRHFEQQYFREDPETIKL
ncbi:hypothetical protein BWQ96_00046 [Gracilariopsis chorda]|uniref:Uncharacterized protein n=1 Tax=Gracilariopsis chorda TaxID=448386 RepID=A0A2V3J634_9FLOR|nr:hypothetical protein BWQ96_00046 [Gracilariopsis chorda]|eukprot:PXF49886.1 hypothetical protein BWQ96_00046 [Gracilariopsis chorda]